MAKPPPTPPSSDIKGVNRDARVGVSADTPQPEPGSAIANAKDDSLARPDETEPQR